MRRVLLAALLFCACHHGPQKPPVIVSFTVDNATPAEGDSISFSYQVTGATSVRIDPLPGPVSASPVTVTPFVGSDFTLSAQNGAGTVQQTITITVMPATPVSVDRFTALPGQAAAGTDVTLSWKVTAAATLSLSDGSSNPPRDVTGVTAVHVNPTVTTVYTLTAQAKPNHTPASASARAVARVVQPVMVSSFTATPSSILQGDPATLSWGGTATSWAVSANGGTPVNRGPLKNLVVRPASNTAYTLIATGPFGTLSPAPQVVVTVRPNPASTLTYTLPAASAKPLMLKAISCSGSTTCVLALVAQNATSLRGVAVDVPIDSTKVTLDPTKLVLNTAVIADTPPAADAVIGSGPLHDTLVFAAARKGNGTATASDVQLNPGDEIAHFTIALASSAGRGPVFDGTTAAGNAAITSVIQSTALGRVAGGVAVGKLDAN